MFDIDVFLKEDGWVSGTLQVLLPNNIVEHVRVNMGYCMRSEEVDKTVVDKE